ncbi:hypothetical protein ASPCAL07711 [Aspergillus calidoustus]|uniref:BZIP domain-containing protein n=1 Tax=Aspergillus calidoustus TaxID=454130 RepID=A0A0U5GV30_ASPCI|nr:hypothetical protein ASPCAL07711 [Aspergillus calidoustus]
MDPRDYSWPPQRFDIAAPTGSDGQGQLPWPMVYPQDPTGLGLTHNYASNVGGFSAPAVNRPRAIGTWSEVDPSPVPENWLPGIMQLELPDSMIQQTVTAKPPEEHPMLTAKRRMQNREAQRRFRKKREEQEMVLQDRISDLEAKCKILRESLNQKSGETELPLREKRELEAQVQVLRKQEQMLLRLLREQKGGLLESFLSQEASMSSSALASPGPGQVDSASAAVVGYGPGSDSMLSTINDNKTM